MRRITDNTVRKPNLLPLQMNEVINNLSQEDKTKIRNHIFQIQRYTLADTQHNLNIAFV